MRLSLRSKCWLLGKNFCSSFQHFENRTAFTQAVHRNQEEKPMTKEINKTKKEYKASSIEWKVLDLLSKRRETYHNFHMGKTSAKIRYWFTLLLGIASIVMYLGLIFYEAYKGNKLGTDFFIASFILPLSFVSCFLQLDRYKTAVECFDEKIPKDEKWLEKRGKAEFLGRTVLYITPLLMTFYFYAITGNPLLLIFNAAFLVNQILKSLHGGFVLWIAKNPKYLQSKTITSFTDSLFYVGNLWFIVAVISPIIFSFSKTDVNSAVYFAYSAGLIAFLKLLTETYKRAKKMEDKNDLGQTHQEVVYFANAQKLIYAFKSEFDQFCSRITNGGKVNVSKRKLSELFAERKAKDENKKPWILQIIRVRDKLEES